MRRKVFRREWIFPALAVAFVSASARAGRDDLSAQAAAEMHCGSVTIIQSSPTEFLASGCGDDRTYECRDDGSCVWVDAPDPTSASADDPEDDAASEAVASALTDMACACASAGLAHAAHHSSSSSSSSSRENHAATRTHTHTHTKHRRP